MVNRLALLGPTRLLFFVIATWTCLSLLSLPVTYLTNFDDNASMTLPGNRYFIGGIAHNR